jgi:hypothetical protein
MKHIAFILTMPNVGSWNGKWTGQSNLYVKVRSYSNFSNGLKNVLKHGNYRYNFGDGWCANIQIKEVTVKEKNNILKKSKGFCGYEWMIDSIETDSTIIAPSDRKRG